MVLQDLDIVRELHTRTKTKSATDEQSHSTDIFTKEWKYLYNLCNLIWSVLAFLFLHKALKGNKYKIWVRSVFFSCIILFVLLQEDSNEWTHVLAH